MFQALIHTWLPSLTADGCGSSRPRSPVWTEALSRVVCDMPTLCSAWRGAQLPWTSVLCPSRLCDTQTSTRREASSAGGWSHGSMFPVRLTDATSEEPEELASFVPSLDTGCKVRRPRPGAAASCLCPQVVALGSGPGFLPCA